MLLLLLVLLPLLLWLLLSLKLVHFVLITRTSSIRSSVSSLTLLPCLPVVLKPPCVRIVLLRVRMLVTLMLNLHSLHVLRINQAAVTNEHVRITRR